MSEKEEQQERRLAFDDVRIALGRMVLAHLPGPATDAAVTKADVYAACEIAAASVNDVLHRMRSALTPDADGHIDRSKAWMDYFTSSAELELIARERAEHPLHVLDTNDPTLTFRWDVHTGFDVAIGAGYPTPEAPDPRTPAGLAQSRHGSADFHGEPHVPSAVCPCGIARVGCEYHR